jgi:hypothetical protein
MSVKKRKAAHVTPKKKDTELPTLREQKRQLLLAHKHLESIGLIVEVRPAA